MKSHSVRRKGVEPIGRNVAALRTRRHFLQISTAVTAGLAGLATFTRPARAQTALQVDRSKVEHRKPYIAIQVGAVSFIDEGTEKVLDIIQEKAHVNTLWLNTYTWERGTGGRQLPGQPMPDHGVQEYDTDFHGGAFYDYDKKYFRNTVLDDFRAPDYKGINILNEVLPHAKKRGIDVFALDMNPGATPFMSTNLKNFSRVAEVDLHGRRTTVACFNNEDYRQHLFGKVEDYLRSYPDLAGIAWACERTGPLLNLINGGRRSPSPYISCFCADCRQKARQRDISVERARLGYMELERLLAATRKDERPADGYFVTFWRLLLEYPEILAWEKLWTDSYHVVRSELYGIAKSIAPEKPFGLHIWHPATLNPFYRAVENYQETRRHADFVKPAIYTNCGGERMAGTLNNLSATLFHDAAPEEIFPLYSRIMNHDEAPYAKLPTAGLSAKYVERETRRAMAGLNGETRVYPGIDVDIPTGANHKKCSPESVRDAVKAAFAAGATGVVLARKYSEMKLTNLAGAGVGLKEAGVI